MKKVLKIIPLIVVALVYYIYLPPINIKAVETWGFLGILIIALLITFSNKINFNLRKPYGQKRPKFINIGKRASSLITGLIVIIALVTAYFTPVFSAKTYSNLINIKRKEFKKDFTLDDINNIPLLDKDSAQKIGDRKLGELTNLVSQYDIDDDYIQINIKNKPYRVSPLKYAGVFKWLNNFRTGIEHFIQVDMTNGDAKLVKLDNPIKYSTADHFSRNILRHVRFKYPFKMTDAPHMEVDDSNKPYYITPVVDKKIFIFGSDVIGVVVTDANTGESKYYDSKDIPKWIDRVHSADRIEQQLVFNGKFKSGFWNSIIAKKGVVQPTEGYNYLAINDDVYYYSGVTSVNADDSSLGFNLVNLRTKEATFYEIPVATETSAMESAQGSVQEKEYVATFPILLKINEKPYYILSLKDNAGLIKSYSLIDAQDYQDVYTEKTIDQLFKTFQAQNNLNIESEEDKVVSEITGTIQGIESVVKNGNSVYYIMIDGNIYQAEINVDKSLPFLKVNDNVKFSISGDKIKKLIR